MYPHTAVSWCKYQAEKINDTNKYKHSPGIPIIIRETTKPIFLSLSEDTLLSKCLHGKTQNNESLNGVIWKRCPKDVFVGHTTVELSVASTVILFNEGAFGIIEVLNKLNTTPDLFTTDFCKKIYIGRINEMGKISSGVIKHRRKQL